MKQKLTCENCKKEFFAYRVQRFCSRECQKENVVQSSVCPQCGKTFTYYKSWPLYHCSRKCAAAASINNHLGVTRLGEIHCEVCGEAITGQKWAGRRFCSQKCYGSFISKTRKGIPRPEVSGPRPEQYRRTLKTCLQCDKEFQVKQSHASRRRFCSKICQAKWQSKNMSGENNFNWKGGYDPYYGPNWLQQRRNARRRDQYTCQRCGKTEDKIGKQLDVHHIKPFRLFGRSKYKQANRVSNLISLCPRCHLAVEPR